LDVKILTEDAKEIEIRESDDDPSSTPTLGLNIDGNELGADDDDYRPVRKPLPPLVPVIPIDDDADTDLELEDEDLDDEDTDMEETLESDEEVDSEATAEDGSPLTLARKGKDPVRDEFEGTKKPKKAKQDKKPKRIILSDYEDEEIE
jgi:hypothetical protein